MKFQSASVEHLPIIQFDHAPILIRTEAAQARIREEHFKFQAAWLTNKDVFEVVERNWNKEGVFVENIKKVSQALTRWNKEVFGSIGRKKKRVVARLDGIHKLFNISTYLGLFKLEKKLQRELEDILYQEELIWFQKSRDEWIVFRIIVISFL